MRRERVVAASQRHADDPDDGQDARGQVEDDQRGQPPSRAARAGRNPEPDDTADEPDEKTADRGERGDEIGQRGEGRQAGEGSKGAATAAPLHRNLYFCRTRDGAFVRQDHNSH